MARLTSALVYAPVMLIYALFADQSGTAAENADKQAAAAPERIIDQLANEHPAGNTRTLDKQRQARVDEATTELIPTWAPPPFPHSLLIRAIIGTPILWLTISTTHRVIRHPP